LQKFSIALELTPYSRAMWVAGISQTISCISNGFEKVARPLHKVRLRLPVIHSFSSNVSTLGSGLSPDLMQLLICCG
jgi:hypothetical protein